MSNQLASALTDPTLRWLMFVQAAANSKTLIPLPDESWSKLTPVFGHPKLEAAEVHVPLANVTEDPTEQYRFAQYALLQAGQELCKQIERRAAGLVFAGGLSLDCKVHPERKVVHLTLLASVYLVVAPAQLLPASVLKSGAPRKVLVRLSEPLFEALHAEAAAAQVPLNAMCVHKLAATLPVDYVVKGVRARRMEPAK